MTNPNLANDEFLLNWGSDFLVDFNWPAATGTALDLTGYTSSLIDIQASLIGRLTFTITNPVLGAVRLAMQWDDALPMGRVAFFRCKLSNGTVDLTSNKLWFRIQ